MPDIEIYQRQYSKSSVWSFLHDRRPPCCSAQPRHGSKTIVLINVARVSTAPTHKVDQLDGARRELIKERAHFSTSVPSHSDVSHPSNASTSWRHEKFDVTEDYLYNYFMYSAKKIEKKKGNKNEESLQNLELRLQ